MKSLAKPAKTLFAVVMVGLFLAACGGSEEQATEESATRPSATEEHAVTSKDVKKEVTEAAQTTMDYAAAKREEYQKEIKAKLDKYQEEINKMAVQSREMTEDAKAALDQRLQVLLDKKEVAQKKLDELRGASGKAWEDLKNGMDAAMDDLKMAFEDASSHFKSPEQEKGSS